jgi:transposase-like protein
MSEPRISLLLCPYCGDSNRKASHRTACYKIKVTKTNKIIFRCVACNKTFDVEKKGDWILKSDNLNVV